MQSIGKGEGGQEKLTRRNGCGYGSGGCGFTGVGSLLISCCF